MCCFAAFLLRVILAIKTLGQQTQLISKSEKKISKRNTGITASNSYSDLFFDSTQLESFITQNNVPILQHAECAVFIIHVIINMHGFHQTG